MKDGNELIFFIVDWYILLRGFTGDLTTATLNVTEKLTASFQAFLAVTPTLSTF